MLKPNPNIKLILADVDETLADIYTDAAPEMISALDDLIEKGIVIFMISGGGYKSIYDRVISKLKAKNRSKVLLGHCSGAEVIGFDQDGNGIRPPYYSLYEEAMSDTQRETWRAVIQDVISKFSLKTHSPIRIDDFVKITNADPLSIMLADRGPQITFELPNSYDLTKSEADKLGVEMNPATGIYDLRDTITKYAKAKIEEYDLPVEIDYGGMFAIDFKLHGVSKTTAVKYILQNKHILHNLGIRLSDIDSPDEIEIWGDKFSEIRGGSDRFMCFAVDPAVRSIDFRGEDPKEFPQGYNIVNWDGDKRLHDGTLEYIKNLVDKL